MQPNPTAPMQYPKQPNFNIQPPPPPAGMLNPVYDLHRAAMGVAMSNLLKRIRPQTQSITGK